MRERLSQVRIPSSRMKEIQPYAIRERHMPDPLIKSKSNGLS